MELPKTARPIEGAIDHWADIDGSIYCLDGRFGQKNKLIKKAPHLNQGYYYIGIKTKQGVKTRRLHRVIAEVFIPNPNNFKIVGHKNNIKTDNRVENLYWTTIKENTQKAYEDGLAKNAKGFEDSQSMPVNMYNTFTNELLGTYGSIIEASVATGISKSTIARQAKYKRPVRKEFYFRYIDDLDVTENIELVGMFNFDTDELLKTFINTADASRKTGYAKKTIQNQVKNNRKPKVKNNDVYFLKLKNE